MKRVFDSQQRRDVAATVAEEKVGNSCWMRSGNKLLELRLDTILKLDSGA